jgi:hypothetical protein
MPARQDITGQRFSRLVVLDYSHTSDKSAAFWRCRCDCGTIAVVRAIDLRRSHTKSCGCLHRELTAARSKTHGHAVGKTKSRLYRLWCGMKDRCENPKCKEYKYYGARGIKLLAFWSASSAAFIADVIAEIGLPPPGTSLDRIDNNRGYEIGNIRWANYQEQQRNKRSNRLLSFGGRMICLAEAAELTGKGSATIKKRLNRGWTDEEACTVPVRGIAKMKGKDRA